MSEEVTEALETETESTNAPDTVEYWKEKARKHEDRSKSNFKELTAAQEAAKKWAEYEENQKSETQKLNERLTAAERAAEESKNALLKYEIATELGLPTKALSLLSGSTKEELHEKATALLELMGSKSDTETTEEVTKAPKPLRSQGVVAGQSPKTPEELFAEKMNRLK